MTVSIPSLLFPVEQEDTAVSRFSNLRHSTNPSHRRVGVPKDPPSPGEQGRAGQWRGRLQFPLALCLCTTHSQRFAPECSSCWGPASRPWARSSQQLEASALTQMHWPFAARNVCWQKEPNWPSVGICACPEPQADSEVMRKR